MYLTTGKILLYTLSRVLVYIQTFGRINHERKDIKNIRKNHYTFVNHRNHDLWE